jgi:hypothetical protein
MGEQYDTDCDQPLIVKCWLQKVARRPKQLSLRLRGYGCGNRVMERTCYASQFCIRQVDYPSRESVHRVHVALATDATGESSKQGADGMHIIAGSSRHP